MLPLPKSCLMLCLIVSPQAVVLPVCWQGKDTQTHKQGSARSFIHACVHVLSSDVSSRLVSFCLVMYCTDMYRIDLFNIAFVLFGILSFAEPADLLGVSLRPNGSRNKDKHRATAPQRHGACAPRRSAPGTRRVSAVLQAGLAKARGGSQLQAHNVESATAAASGGWVPSGALGGAERLAVGHAAPPLAPPWAASTLAP